MHSNVEIDTGTYLDGLDEGLAATDEERQSRSDLPPIEVPPGAEYIEMRRSRADVLRQKILPNLDG